MNRQLQGIAVMLLSILLILVFDSMGETYVFDLNFHWSTVFMAIGIFGFAMVFKHK